MFMGARFSPAKMERMRGCKEREKERTKESRQVIEV